MLAKPENGSRGLSAIDLDQDDWIITNNPSSVTRLGDDGGRGDNLLDTSVFEFDHHGPLGQEADVDVLAPFGSGDGLHVITPNPARRIDHSLHSTVAGRDFIDGEPTDNGSGGAR